MKGKRTDSKLIEEIDILRTGHSPSEIIKKMDRRMSRRTVYRILSKLKAEEEERKREEDKRRREKAEREMVEYLEFLESRKRYKSSDFPRGLWRVRSY